MNQTDTPVSMDSIRVLHVYDEPDFAEVTAEFIERHNNRITVQTTTNVPDALDHLTRADFDCIVSDYDMPNQTGIEFLETVREIHPDLPFILYTGKGSEEVASDAIHAGVTDYLQKESGTSQYDVLANRITNAVQNYRAQYELADREHRLNLFFEQSPLGVIRWDDEFNFARVNDTAADILGYQADELEGEPWDVVIPEEARDEIGEIVVSDLLADEGGYHSINENVRKDGERITCEWHNWVVTDESDEVVAVFSQFQDITDRKERKQELTDLADYNQEIVENAPVGLFRLDEQMRITHENQRAEDIVGVPEGKDESPAIGRDLRDLPSVQDAGAIEALNRLEAGETVSFETPFQSIYGKDSYLSGKGVPLIDDDGAYAGAVIMVHDITDRRETEQILEQLRKNITDVVWVTTPAKDSMEFISEAYEDVMGRPTESLREEPLSFVEAIHPEDRDRVQAALEDQQDDPDSYEETYRIIRPDGDQRWIHDRAAGIYEGENLIRIVGIASDITDQKERERERAYHEVFEKIPDGVTLHDPSDGSIIKVNQQFCDMLGYQRDELLELEFEALHADEPPYTSETAEEYLRLAASEGSQTFEWRDQTKDGDIVPVEVHLRHTMLGGTDRVLAVVRDISERKQREREIEQLESFAGVLSHDLRNPLSVAAGRLELARTECESPHLDAIEKAHDRMEAIIEDLLTLAREGETVGALEIIELDETCWMCWENVATGEAALVVDSELSIEADRSRVAQLLENLFRNAIEHGGADVTITVGDLPDGFYVEDDGPGIPESDRERVFDVGYSTTEEGTGIGLRIVREIATAHGWEIECREGSDGGACFAITGVQSEPES